MSRRIDGSWISSYAESEMSAMSIEGLRLSVSDLNVVAGMKNRNKSRMVRELRAWAGSVRWRREQGLSCSGRNR